MEYSPRSSCEFVMIGVYFSWNSTSLQMIICFLIGFRNRDVFKIVLYPTKMDFTNLGSSFLLVPLAQKHMLCIQTLWNVQLKVYGLSIIHMPFLLMNPKPSSTEKRHNCLHCLCAKIKVKPSRMQHMNAIWHMHPMCQVPLVGSIKSIII